MIKTNIILGIVCLLFFVGSFWIKKNSFSSSPETNLEISKKEGSGEFDSNKKEQQERLKIKFSLKNETEWKEENQKLKEALKKVKEKNETLFLENQVLTKKAASLEQFLEKANEKKKRLLNISPYKVEENSEKKENSATDNASFFQQMRRNFAFLKGVEELSSLTEDQKIYFKVLREEFRKLRIDTLKNEENLSREEIRDTMMDGIKQYSEKINESLTPEQSVELDKKIENNLKKEPQFPFGKNESVKEEK